MTEIVLLLNPFVIPYVLPEPQSPLRYPRHHAS
jgi:hypothetical protein